MFFAIELQTSGVYVSLHARSLFVPSKRFVGVRRKLVWGCTSEGDTRVADGAMRAAGFVEVKVDVTRLKGYARWTPVVGTKAS